MTSNGTVLTIHQILQDKC